MTTLRDKIRDTLDQSQWEDRNELLEEIMETIAEYFTKILR